MINDAIVLHEQVIESPFLSNSSRLDNNLPKLTRGRPNVPGYDVLDSYIVPPLSFMMKRVNGRKLHAEYQEGRTKKRKIIHKIHILCCQFIHFLWDLVYVKVKSQKVGISVSPPECSVWPKAPSEQLLVFKKRPLVL
jgi:hypothetical protein